MKPIEVIKQEEADMEEYFMKPLFTKELLEINPQDIVQPILDGHSSAITGLEAIQHLAKVLTECKKMIEDIAVEEAERYHKLESIPTQLGYRITLKAGRRMYKYHDPLIKSLEQKLKYYKDCAKNQVAIEETGEILDQPSITHTKDTLTFTKL